MPMERINRNDHCFQWILQKWHWLKPVIVLVLNYPPELLPSLPNQPSGVAIKKGPRVDSLRDLQDLKREVMILEACDHPHLLPLLGHCLDKRAPCLIFPLMVGGSLQCRLDLSESGTY